MLSPLKTQEENGVPPARHFLYRTGIFPRGAKLLQKGFDVSKQLILIRESTVYVVQVLGAVTGRSGTVDWVRPAADRRFGCGGVQRLSRRGAVRTAASSGAVCHVHSSDTGCFGWGMRRYPPRYFFRVAMPPRMWRWALLTSRISFTCRYSGRLNWGSRSEMSLCTAVTKWNG